MDVESQHPYYAPKDLNKELCFKNDMHNGFAHKPFQIYVKPESFYSYQLSQIKPNENIFFQNINNDLICHIIELISYQIQYTNHLNVVLDFLQKKSQNEFSSLAKNFNHSFENYQKAQMNFAAQSKILLAQPQNDQLIQKFIPLLLSQANSFDIVNSYAQIHKKNESLLQKFSNKYSEEASLELDGLTIIQVLSSFKQFLQLYVESTQKMISFLDQNDQKLLLQINLAFQALFDKMKA